MKKMTQVAAAACGLILSAVLFAGCASPAMKGTPFFTGEYDQRMGPAEDRINLWPVLYYRHPALSAFWPLVEFTDDHFAFRPLMSVYGLNQDEQVYNVLWPMAEFNNATGDNRVFPVFWGTDYLTAFPLYWHFGHPAETSGGTDTFLPLWYYTRNRTGSDTYILGPVIHFKNKRGEKGWHVWPLTGHYWTDRDSYRFALWPLGHQWSDSAGGQGNALLPLYWYSGDSYASLFISPIFSRWNETSSGDGWNLLLPLFYASKDGSERFLATLLGGCSSSPSGTNWVAIPLLSCGETSGDSRKLSVVWPLSYFGSDKDTSRQYIFPAYYRSVDRNGSVFISIPWSSGRSANGNAWQLVPPLFYAEQNGENDRTFATLLGGYHRRSDRVNWLALPILSGGSNWRDDSDVWIGGPLAHFYSDKDSSVQHVFPLYYRGADKNGSLFLSLPWSSGSYADGSSWRMVPPLFYQVQDREGAALITPLYARGENKSSGVRWNTVIPLYYRTATSNSSTIATLLGGVHNDSDGKSWLIYPLLSGGTRDQDSGDIWIAAPIFHAAWDKDRSSQHLLPLYYWNSEDQMFLSPLAARWRTGDKGNRITAVPPLVSWMESDGKTKDLWLTAGLAHMSWGENPGSQHVLPLFYRDAKSGTFISPIAAKWRSGDAATNYLFPPALSWLTSAPDRSDLWLVGPMAHWSWGPQAGSRHVLPLFYSDARSETFLSPLVMKWGNEDSGKVFVIPPALSWIDKDKDRTDLWLAAALARFSWGRTPDPQYVCPLFYNDSASGTFLSLPVCTWTEGNKSTWIYPPLLSQYSNNGVDRELYAALGLFRQEWGRNGASGHLLPLYLYGNRYFYSPVFGWDKAGGDGFVYPLTPIAGVLTGERRSGGWLFPLIWHEREKATDNLKGRFLLWGYYNRRADYADSGFCPLWEYSCREIPQKGIVNARGSLLFWLYDYRRDVRPGDAKTAKDYTRRRVLWRLYHYERSSGDVSVDVFPAITYDSKTDGFKKVSFLWRFFRYENGKSGKKLDVLFLPLMRTKPIAE